MAEATIPPEGRKTEESQGSQHESAELLSLSSSPFRGGGYKYLAASAGKLTS